MPRMTICRSRLTLVVLLLGAAAVPFSVAVSQATATPTSYTVKRGDTLMSIARQLFGDEARWQDIYRLNADVLADPNSIRPGQVLKISGVAAEAQPAQPRPVAARPPAAAAAAPDSQELTMPTPQPVRRPVIVEPDPAQDPVRVDSTFAKRRGLDARSALRTYREQPYRPLRRGEFFAAGYLTEGDDLPFGTLLGTVTPPQIRNLSARTTATLYSEVALRAPAGGSYRDGDSLLVVQTFPGPRGFGEIVLPTGMARVTGRNGDQVLATIIAVFGPIRAGHLTIPVGTFTGGGTTRAQPVENGVRGTVLGQREVRELKHPQDFLFIDKGTRDGVARGDIFEVRREAGESTPGSADTTDELMAVLQVVHVRDRSATVKVINVVSPDIPPGTPAIQVARLPN